MLAFFVRGLPIAQPRHRVGVVQGHARTYLPKKHAVHAFKGDVQLVAARTLAGREWDFYAPFEVRLIFTFPLHGNLRKPKPREWRTKKPDVDNLAKSVLDACNGVLWNDDAQVVCLVVEKWTAGTGEEPGVLVEVERAE